jgi:hypothetical protein
VLHKYWFWANVGKAKKSRSSRAGQGRAGPFGGVSPTTHKLCLSHTADSLVVLRAVRPWRGERQAAADRVAVVESRSDGGVW